MQSWLLENSKVHLISHSPKCLSEGTVEGGGERSQPKDKSSTVCEAHINTLQQLLLQFFTGMQTHKSHSMKPNTQLVNAHSKAFRKLGSLVYSTVLWSGGYQLAICGQDANPAKYFSRSNQVCSLCSRSDQTLATGLEVLEID